VHDEEESYKIEGGGAQELQFAVELVGEDQSDSSEASEDVNDHSCAILP
jgi:hypothetical protein